MAHGNANMHRYPIVRRRPGELRTELESAARAETDECVILAGYRNRPVVTFDGKVMHASRAVWIIANGDPGNDWVLHTCHRGDEGCINRRHLYTGDHAQNTLDMVDAGRSTRGGRSANARFTEVEICQIRNMAHAGTKQTDIARVFGTTQPVISRVVNRKTWAWLQCP